LVKRPISRKQQPKPKTALSEAQRIDQKYGLEPVIEPGVSEEGSAQFHVVSCPYCGENFETQLDTSSGSARYIEDCQVCCQPIEFSIEVDQAGALQSLSTQRS
jgi:hypothetical protein